MRAEENFPKEKCLKENWKNKKKLLKEKRLENSEKFPTNSSAKSSDKVEKLQSDWKTVRKTGEFFF